MHHTASREPGPTPVHPATGALLSRVCGASGAPQHPPEGAVALLSSWLGDVGPDLANLPRGLDVVLPANAVAYQQWHLGGVDGAGPGFVALHRWCIRVAGNIDRGSEAASETYLDVRDRLAGVVAACRADSKVIDLRQPHGEPRQNVDRYHKIQARFRIQGRWRRERSTVLYDDARALDPQRPGGRAEARTYALPLYVAGRWYQHDAARLDRGLSRWWPALLHGLGLDDTPSSDAGRNDPTEAVLRLRVRLSACIGLSRWLRLAARDRPTWTRAHFGLPQDRANDAENADLQVFLECVRPALQESIAHVNGDAAERAALLKILVLGRTVRNQVRVFAGDTSAARRERLFELAEVAGTRASLVLLDGRGDGGGTGGGSGDDPSHAAARASMKALLAGKSLPSAQVMAFQAHIGGCRACADVWAALCDMADPDSRAAWVQPQGADSADRTWRQRPVLIAAVLAVAVGVSIAVVRPTPPPELGLRGAEVAPSVGMDLFVVERGKAEATRLNKDRRYSVGDRLYFRVYSPGAAATASVWVEGPAGREAIGAAQTGSEGAWLEAAGGRLFYELDALGEHRFSVSPDGEGPCVAGRCMTVTVVVER